MFFDVILEVLASAIRYEKEIKGIHYNRRNESVFITGNVTVYIENSKRIY